MGRRGEPTTKRYSSGVLHRAALPFTMNDVDETQQERRYFQGQQQQQQQPPPSIEEVINVQSIEEAHEIQAKIRSLVRIPTREEELEMDEEREENVDNDDNDERAGRTGSKTQGVVIEDEGASLPGHNRRRKIILALDIAYSTKSDLAVASGVLWQDEGKGESNSSEGNRGKNVTGQRAGTGRVLAERVLSGRVRFPYQPGLLAFREIPLLVDVIRDLLSVYVGSEEQVVGKESSKKIIQGDVTLLCDGAGIAHPRFCGIACHLGVLFQIPSIGVAKNHLVGELKKAGGKDEGEGEGRGEEEDDDDKKLSPTRGSSARLCFQNTYVGSVLRSQDNVRPIFVSPGHLVSIERAMQTVLGLCSQYRLPEPIRRADHIGRIELKRIEREQEKEQ